MALVVVLAVVLTTTVVVAFVAGVAVARMRLSMLRKPAEVLTVARHPSRTIAERVKAFLIFSY